MPCGATAAVEDVAGVVAALAAGTARMPGRGSSWEDAVAACVLLGQGRSIFSLGSQQQVQSLGAGWCVSLRVTPAQPAWAGNGADGFHSLMRPLTHAT